MQQKFYKKTSNLNSGKIGYFEIPNEINYDIDTMEDLNQLKKVSNKTLKNINFMINKISTNFYRRKFKDVGDNIIIRYVCKIDNGKKIIIGNNQYL